MAASLPPERGSVPPLAGVVGVNFVACTVIALLLWALVPPIGRYGFVNVFVNSQLIGQCIAVLMVLLKRVLGERLIGRVSWYRLLAAPVAALGLLFGLWLASVALGSDPPLGGLMRARQELVAVLLTTAVATIVGVSYFDSRGRELQSRALAAEEARRASAAQLAMLRAQVEPHMLFNTLAHLRALIGIDPERAREMLDRLIELLRATLDGSRAGRTSLADEFDLLDHYLALMAMRLGKRLCHRLSLPPALRALTLPALMLQPLVENAIVHGIEPARDGGEITVEATRIGNELVIRVRDTGVGIDHERIARQKREHQHQHQHQRERVRVRVRAAVDGAGRDVAAGGRSRAGSGFGLASVRERLQALHGDRATLRIESPLPGGARGTLIIVRMPIEPTGTS